MAQTLIEQTTTQRSNHTTSKMKKTNRTSATHQISHTKGGVLVGQGIGFEGSMNWSISGEGVGVSLTKEKSPAGFKAQNNTLLVSCNPVFIARLSARLDAEHSIALQQQKGREQ